MDGEQQQATTAEQRAMAVEAARLGQMVWTEGVAPLMRSHMANLEPAGVHGYIGGLMGSVARSLTETFGHDIARKIITTTLEMIQEMHPPQGTGAGMH